MPLRVGTVPYLVARPLTAGLAESGDIELITAPPADLARMLVRGEVDVALASSSIALENESLAFWHAGPVIAARAAVRSVLLFLRPGLTDPSLIRDFVPDPHSRTGRALAAIALREHFKAPFTRRELSAEQDPFNSGADAVQIIGDPALLAETAHPDWSVIDLGSVWEQMTALPFVYAGWIGRRGFDPDDAAEPLMNAARRGVTQLEPLIEEGMATLGRSRDFMLRYLGQDLTYFMPESEIRDALSAFSSRLSLLK